MQGLGPARQFDEVSLQSLGEGIEETPDVARLEIGVSRFAPVLEDLRNMPVGTDANVTSPDDEVMGGAVVNVVELVACQTGILMMPSLHELADSGLDQPGQIPGDKPRMFPGEFDLSTEGKVIADENLCASCYSGGECLVVRVPQPQHPAVILIGFATLDFHEAEVSGIVVAKAVGLSANDEPVELQRLLDLSDELDVRDRRPGVGGPGCRDIDDLFAFRRPSSAMKQEVRATARENLWPVSDGFFELIQ